MKCPLGGDIRNNCADCVYSIDYRFDTKTGECIRIPDKKLRAKGVKMKKMNVDAVFSKLIRDQMNNTEFWKWASEWYDSENIIDAAESWDEGLKRECINDYEDIIIREGRKK